MKKRNYHQWGARLSPWIWAASFILLVMGGSVSPSVELTGWHILSGVSGIVLAVVAMRLIEHRPTKARRQALR